MYNYDSDEDIRLRESDYKKPEEGAAIIDNLTFITRLRNDTDGLKGLSPDDTFKSNRNPRRSSVKLLKEAYGIM
ncbi:hypothetical protein TNCV_841381 [Trichonephila clavipes]|nr:hypothetical protein TNCV_841381 [Trichonephila clavipes]